MSSTHTIENVLAIKETEKALQVVIGKDKFWVPKSQIHDDSEVYKDGDEGDLIVTEWFAEKRGWL